MLGISRSSNAEDRLIDSNLNSLIVRFDLRSGSYILLEAVAFDSIWKSSIQSEEKAGIKEIVKLKSINLFHAKRTFEALICMIYRNSNCIYCRSHCVTEM